MFEPFPQILKNVHFRGLNPIEDSSVQIAIAKAEKELGDEGRVLIRKSGTEPLIRIMIEGKNHSVIDGLAGDIAEVVQKLAG